MVNRSDSLGPLADNPRYRHPAENYRNEARAPRVPWHDGRVYRHTDGTPCGAGQNELGETIKGVWPDPTTYVTICTVHVEEVELAPRYRHEEDPNSLTGDCDATPDQVTQYPGEAPLCTLHELPVEKVW